MLYNYQSVMKRSQMCVLRGFNPFTAPACKMSGPKDAQRCLQTVYFFARIASALNAMCFDKNPFS